jgi:ankyrin repeat protein
METVMKLRLLATIIIIACGTTEFATAMIRGGSSATSEAACDGRTEVEKIDCAICLMECTSDNAIRMLPCRHFFHRDCITEWLKVRNNCPICRASASLAITLHQAVWNGKLDVLVDLLAAGADVNALDATNKTPLHLAAILSQTAIVQALINTPGINLNATSIPDMMTPLHFAVYARDKTKVDMLLAAGANPNAPNIDKETPLHIAAKKNLPQIIQTLLNAQANPLLQDIDNMTPLHIAARWDSAEAADILVKASVSPNVQNRQLKTPLHIGVDNDRKKIVQTLLSLKANPNIGDDCRNTPLHFAARFNLTKMAEILLINGAFPDALNHNGRTPLYIAVLEGNPIIIGILLDFGANPNPKDRFKLTALHCAARKGFAEMVDALLTGGAEINAQGQSDMTALHWAAQYGHTETVETLLARPEINTEIINDLSQTALEIAATDTIRDLIQAHNESFAAANHPGTDSE